jgi:hypothetical protein
VKLPCRAAASNTNRLFSDWFGLALVISTVYDRHEEFCHSQGFLNRIS